MIETAIELKRKERGGRMAVITFCACRYMRVGFTDSFYAIVTAAAVTKDFLMVSERDDGSPLGRMACLAHITGTDMVR